MFPLFLVLSIAVILSAAGPPNPIQLNELSEKMLNGPYEGEKGLGYLYSLDTMKSLCGVALINLRTIIADSSCVPEGTDISEIYAIFGRISDQEKLQVSHVSMPEYISENQYNVTLVILCLVKQLKVTNHVSPLKIWGLPFVHEGPAYMIGWNEKWQIAVDNITISDINMESRAEIFFAHNENECNLLEDSGRLIIRGRMILAISLMTKNEVQPIVYLFLEKVLREIKAAIEDQEQSHRRYSI